jgi:hypothetical protein
MMPSFVEKTLQVQSGLTHGTDKETPADFLKYPASRIIRPPHTGVVSRALATTPGATGLGEPRLSRTLHWIFKLWSIQW